MRVVFTLLSLSFILACSNIGCKKNLPDLNPGKMLTPFEVNVVTRAPNEAIINWTESKDIFTSDTVKYDVTLGGKLIDSNLIDRIDTLYNLIPDSIYYGVIYAKTFSGDTASAVFVLAKVNGYIIWGDNSGLLNCRNLYTGTYLWRTTFSANGYWFQGAPTVTDSVVYSNAEGNGIFAINVKTGAKIWNKTFGPGEGGLGNPLVHDGRVYTITEHAIHCLDAKTGDALWDFAEGNDYYQSSPVIGNNRLFEFANGGVLKIVAVDVKTGQKSWESVLNCRISENPVLYNNLIIFGASDGGIYAFDQETGQKVWTRYFVGDGANAVSPRISGKYVLVHSAVSGYYCLYAANGTTVWNFPEASGRFTSSPAVGNGRVYFSVQNNSFSADAYALDINTGALIWRKSMEEKDEGTPIYANNHLYFSDFSWGILVMNAEDGIIEDRIAESVRQVSPATIVINDSVFYTAESGMIQ
jgi:outer membrane protein assembly factor BamB